MLDAEVAFASKLLKTAKHKSSKVNALADTFLISLIETWMVNQTGEEACGCCLGGHGFDCRKTTNKKHTSGSS